MANILYVTFTGLTEPLGQSQVSKYLEGLSQENEIWLLSLEKETDKKAHAAIQDWCDGQGIHWKPVPYRKYRPRKIAIAHNILTAIQEVKKILDIQKIDLVHARSHPASLVALFAHKRYKIPYLFDLRGFTAEERVDSNQWKRSGIMYKSVRLLDQKTLNNASGIVVLTNAAESIVRKEFNGSEPPPIQVIPTCVDLETFHRASTGEGNDQFVLGYVGSASGRYGFDDAVSCFKELKEHTPGPRFLILNRGDHGSITRKLSEAGVQKEEYELISAEHHEMPEHLSRMDAAVFPLPATKSSSAASPTKMGELLACGVPCLTTAAVGDAKEILEGNRVGVVLKSFGPTERKVAMERLYRLANEKDVSERCRRVAERRFSLTDGVLAYKRMYQEIVIGGR